MSLLQKLRSAAKYILASSFLTFFTGCLDNPNYTRALWLWGSTNIKNIITNYNAREEFFNFLKKPCNKYKSINRLFIAYPLDNATSSQVNEFLCEAKSRGIDVEYLIGNNQYVESITGFNEAMQEINKLAEYNRSYPCKFDALHIDIEPLEISSWNNNKEEIWSRYIAIIKNARESLNSLETAVNVDIDMRYDPEGFKTESYLDIINNVDRVTFMSYSDGAEISSSGLPGIIQLAKPFANIANNYAIPFWVGIETSSYAPYDWMTFQQEGLDFMEEQIKKVAEKFSNYSWFKGIAIHYYDSYKQLCPEESKSNDCSFKESCYQSNCVLISDCYCKDVMSGGNIVGKWNATEHTMYVNVGYWIFKSDNTYEVYNKNYDYSCYGTYSLNNNIVNMIEDDCYGGFTGQSFFFNVNNNILWLGSDFNSQDKVCSVTFEGVKDETYQEQNNSGSDNYNSNCNDNAVGSCYLQASEIDCINTYGGSYYADTGSCCIIAYKIDCDSFGGTFNCNGSCPIP